MEKIKSTKATREEIIFYPIKFKVVRIIKGLTLEELEKLSGITRKTISKIEKGNCTRITKKTYQKLISVLGQMLTSRRGYEFDQIRQRIIVRKKVYNDYTPEEIASIFPQLDKECLIHMIKLANDESLRGAKKLYDIALKYCTLKNQPINIKILTDTQSQMQEGFM